MPGGQINIAIFAVEYEEGDRKCEPTRITACAGRLRPRDMGTGLPARQKTPAQNNKNNPMNRK